MRLKTFLASYLLFLTLLFATIGTISVHLTNSQMSMVKNRSLREYRTISLSLANDMANLPNFKEDLPALMNGYIFFYSGHFIHLSLVEEVAEQIEATFLETDFVRITGPLLPPFEHFQLIADFEIADSMMEVQAIQQTLLVLAILFSLVGAVALHMILSRIFKPLKRVARAATQIANGNYHERILLSGGGELKAVAHDFNRMAEEIENKVQLLETEAIQKQQFVDNFAHEVRTPLTSIYGYAEYLQKATFKEEEQFEFTAYIMEEADHMKKIANSLLELATLRNFTPEIAPIYLEELFQDIFQTLERQLALKHITLNFESHGQILNGQRDLIRSLLLNLLSNSLKACEMGGEIHLKANVNQIQVVDNGRGIPQANLSKLMEPFYRVDKSRSRDEGGVGLGLALCRQIMEAHNGEIAITSEVGQGTAVTLTFPKEAAHG